MRGLGKILFTLLALVLPALGQFTTVSGTVTDPNGLPYANGTIVPILSVSGTPTFTSTGFPYTPPSQPVGLDTTGSFLMQLADNTQLSPAGSKWNFQVCSNAGTIQPAGGKGPVCFTLAAPITISGSSQSITTQLTAAAVALSFNPGTGTITGGGTAAKIPLWNSGTALTNSALSDNGTTILSSEPLSTPSVNLSGTGAFNMTGSGAGCGALPALAAGTGGFGLGPGCVPEINTNGAGWVSIGAGGTPAWSALTAAAGNLTLPNAGNSTTFNQTSAVNWTWANTTAATNVLNQSTPIFNLNGNFWNGAASAATGWSLQGAVTGTNFANSQNTLQFTQTGADSANVNFLANQAFLNVNFSDSAGTLLNINMASNPVAFTGGNPSIPLGIALLGTPVASNVPGNSLGSQANPATFTASSGAVPAIGNASYAAVNQTGTASGNFTGFLVSATAGGAFAKFLGTTFLTTDFQNDNGSVFQVGKTGAIFPTGGGSNGTLTDNSGSTGPANSVLTAGAANAVAWSTTPKVATMTTTGNAAFGGPGPFTDVTTQGVTTGSQTAAALNTAIAACNGGTLFFPPSLGSITFTSQITVNAACTLKAEPGTVTLTLGFNSGVTATSGLILVSTNNVNLVGLSVNGNSGTNTGRVITVFNAGAQVTHTKMQNLSVTNCNNTCLRIDGVSDFELASSRLQAVSTEFPLLINSSNNSLQDVRIHDSIIDGTSIVNGNHGSLELQAAGTNVEIGPNNTIYGGDWYGAEIGLFTTSTVGVGVLKNFNFHDNVIYETNANNHGGVSFGGGNAPPCSISHNTVDVTNVATGGGQGFELNGVEGCSIDGNVFNLDSTGTINGIFGDGVNNSTISHNVVNGFGGNGGAGISLNAGQNQAAISSCSVGGGQPPFLVTCSLAAMPSFLFNGIVIDNVGNSPATYNGFWTVVSRTGANGGAGTYSFYVPGAPGAFVSGGNVQQTTSNNVVEANQVIFPVFGTRTGTLDGIQLRCGISASTSLCNNNRFLNNIVLGTNVSGERGITFTGAGTQDSNVAAGNQVTNLATGIFRNNGTNSQFLLNRMIGVATAWGGSVQSGEIVDQVDSIATANLTAGFGTGPSVPAGAMNTKSFRITVGTTPGTTGTIGGLSPVAPTGWNCWLTDFTTAGIVIRQSGGTSASASFTFATAPTAADVLTGGCNAF